MTPILKKIHWVCGTHWDREWHRPFEGFRCRLVDMIDRAIECIENVPGYPCFLLDGQSIILKDYLEARPEQREKIGRLLRENKLFAGPFYVLQDEMIEDGELFIRNLQKGIAVARRHGSTQFVGYSTDSFGHAAQLPQMLKLAGVDAMVFGRAYLGGQHDNIWRSPDGSEVFFIWLPLGNGPGVHKDCLEDARHISEDRAEAIAMFERFLTRLEPYIRNPSLLIMDAADHLSADPAAARLLADFNRKYPAGPELRMSSLPDAIRDIVKQGSPARVQGEIRMTGPAGDNWLLPGTMTTRMPLKIGLSDLTRRLLVLEKLHTLLPYSSTTQGAFDRAWDQLLQNIPHDSICGCHTDEVYIDNLTRLIAARGVADYLTEKSLRSFHPASKTTGKTATAILYDPAPIDGAFKPFVIECPYPVIDDPSQVQLDASGLQFIISDVERYPTFNAHLPTYRMKGFLRNTTGANVVNATIRTGDARSQPRALFEHSPLLTFVDGADVGDTYNYCPPASDALVVSTGTPVSIVTRSLADGLIQTQAEVRFATSASLTSDRKGRSDAQVDLRIRYEITRDISANLTWISGSVYNLARDHRLRLVIPCAIADSHSLAGAPFHIERRPVELDIDPEPCSERPVTDYPFVDYIRYANQSVYSHCNGEYQVTERGIEITLVRCVGWLGRNDLAWRKGQAGPRREVPLAQLLDTEIPFSFILAPSLADLAADYARRELLAPVLAQCTLSVNPPTVRAKLPIGIQGVECTALRWAEPGKLEVRLFNPRPETAQAILNSTAPLREICATDLHHAPLKEGPLFKNVSRATFPMRPFQILTLIAIPAVAP